MRPLRLQVENFTAFRGKHPPLDLAACELFAIAGPTGSGKSSLLDAIVFGLYGKVPRLGKGISEMISLGRDRLSVVLDFALGERVLRVTRVVRRGRGGDVQLEELTGGEERPLESGVNAVNDAIERLVGLSYEAFTQAVILPQGEFARFLKSQPRDRRGILRDLLRLEVLERMRERASREAAQADAELKSKAALFEGEYVGATADAVASGERSLADARDRVRCLGTRVDAAAAEVADLRIRNDQTRELREKRRKAADLAHREGRIREAEAALDAARRAAPVVPRIERAEAAAKKRDEAHARRDTAQAERDRAAQSHAAARSALDAALVAAAEVPAWSDRLRALDGAVTLLDPRAAAAERLARAQAEGRERSAELVEAERKKAANETRLAAAEEALTAAAQNVTSLGYDGARHGRLEAFRDIGIALGSARAEAVRLEAALREAQAALNEAVEDAAGSRSEGEVAARRLAQAELRRAETDEVLVAARRDHAAAHLRTTLRKGESCPVCDRRVDRLPGAASAPLLVEIEGRCEAALQDEARAREAAARAREVVAAAEQAVTRATDAVERCSKELQACREAVRSHEEALAPVEADLVRAPNDVVEASLRTALADLAQVRGHHDAASSERDRALRERDLAAHAVGRDGEAVQSLRAAHAEVARRVAEAEKEWRGLDERVKALGDGDPRAERADLTRRREGVEKARADAEQAERAAGLALRSAEAALEGVERAVTEARDEAETAGVEAARALQEAGFEGPSGVRAAYRSLAEQEQMVEAIATYHGERHALAGRIDELATLLGGAEVEDAALQAAEDGLAKLREESQAAAREEAGLEQRLSDLRRRADQAAALEKEIAQIRRQHGTYRQLAEDLSSDRFQAYVLEEAFRGLVAGASQRLLTLSGRYSLEFEDEAFLVVDHDNAREKRSAETLSGGETFLASLALALELSQEVQRAAGAVHVGSLFIDEGFGTLDPETLETVADAVFSLPVGGRLVGIISHLPELTERLPTRLTVVKRPEGSTVVVDAG